jgi:hypothetical protein
MADFEPGTVFRINNKAYKPKEVFVVVEKTANEVYGELVAEKKYLVRQLFCFGSALTRYAERGEIEILEKPESLKQAV